MIFVTFFYCFAGLALIATLIFMVSCWLTALLPGTDDRARQAASLAFRHSPAATEHRLLNNLPGFDLEERKPQSNR